MSNISKTCETLMLKQRSEYSETIITKFRAVLEKGLVLNNQLLIIKKILVHFSLIFPGISAGSPMILY